MTTLKVPIGPDDHIQGNQDAVITLVEYGDYQCSYCGQAYYVIEKVRDHFGEQMKFVFRNFPLTEVHPYAEMGAEAAEFANLHNLFWEMHDLIYENQETLSFPFFMELGDKLKLPRDELMEAIHNKTYEHKIKKDFMGGVRSGVNGTPTFFINGERYSGPFEYPELVLAIESVFAK